MDLAWALVQAADQSLRSRERFNIYVALGAGDAGAAIAELIRAVAREQLPLPADVVASLAVWRSAQPPELSEELATLIAELKIRPEGPAPAPQRLAVARRRRPFGRRGHPKRG